MLSRKAMAILTIFFRSLRLRERTLPSVFRLRLERKLRTYEFRWVRELHDLTSRLLTKTGNSSTRAPRFLLHAPISQSDPTVKVYAPKNPCWFLLCPFMSWFRPADTKIGTMAEG